MIKVYFKLSDGYDDEKENIEKKKFLPSSRL
jgi:hypothetical protein